MSPATNSHDPDGGPESDAGRMGKVGSGPSMNPDAPADWWYSFVGLGVVCGTMFWLGWSFLMSIAMWHDLPRILLGPGAGCGLFFGFFFGLTMGFVMRPAIASAPIGDPNEFWRRSDAIMAGAKRGHCYFPR